MNANEIVNVLRACGNGNSVCEKCPFYIREDSNECRFNAIYESADTIEAQQQEIEQLKTRISDIGIYLDWILRDINESDKVYIYASQIKAQCGAYGGNSSKILLERMKAFTADKDEQAGRIMRMESGLRRLKRSFQWLSEDMRGRGYKDWAEDKMNDIDALLGGAEDESVSSHAKKL